MEIPNKVSLLTGWIMLAMFHLPACQNNKVNTGDTQTDPLPRIEIQTFRSDTLDKASGWGYDIYVSGALFIHQPHIPAVRGNTGFNTEQDARKTAEFVAGKIRKNIFPPAVSIPELDSLGVLEIPPASNTSF
jgi:hypothetical protein